MKIRTDFVTNSSSSSYIAFTIKNIPLFNALTKLGITFPRAKNGMFTDGLEMTLPSGLTARPHFSDSDRHFLSSGFDSILEWLREVWFDEPDGGGLVVDANKDSCKNDKDNDDIDDDDSEDWDDYFDIEATRSFLSEFAALLEGAGLSTFDAFEGNTEYANVDQLYDNDGEPGPYVYTEVKNGRKLCWEWIEDEYWKEKPDLHGCRFAVAGVLHYLDMPILFDVIRALGGKLEETVQPETDFVICNDIHDSSDNMNLAWDFGIPLLPEMAFINNIVSYKDFDKQFFGNILEKIKDVRCYTIADAAGVAFTYCANYSPFIFEKWEDGKWISCDRKDQQ